MHDFKNFFNRLFKTPMLIVFFIICIVLLPSAINLRSIAFRAGIVVALGIDINEEEKYILDAVITIPSLSEDLNENNKIISSSGISLIDALGNMNLVFGRAIRLGHVRFVVIGKNLAQKNVAMAIDGIIRTNKIRDSVQLVMCEDNVHELFNIGIQLKNKTGIRLSDIICHTESYSTTSFDSNVDAFYKGFFSKSGISKLNSISLTDNFALGVSPMPDAKQNGENMGGLAKPNGQSGNEQSNKYISNIGKMAIFKDGKLQTILSGNLSASANWVNSSYLPKKLVVDVGMDQISKICYEVLNKSVVTEAFFLKGIPMYYCKINLTIDINEILNTNSQIISKNSDVITDEVKSDIGKVFRKQVASAVEFIKTSKLDIMDINNYFYLNVYDEYNNYIKTKSYDEFLEDVQISVDVNIKII